MSSDFDWEGPDSFQYMAYDGCEDSAPTTVSLTVVRPTVDINVDTNNDGKIDPATDDPANNPAFEETAPGMVLVYNDDDDNSNGIADRLDSSPFKNSSGNLATDDELRPAALAYDAKGANLGGFTLSMVVDAGNVKLWSDASKQAELTTKTWTLGTDVFPAGLAVEGYNPGYDKIDLVLKNPQGTEIARDRVVVVTVKVDTVTFNPSQSTAEVTDDNPDGSGGTPNFGGGWRAFPDARSYDDRANSHNLVRVKATLTPPVPGVGVYFASYDVDDPSNGSDDAKSAIDKNDYTFDSYGDATFVADRGGDNRGTFGSNVFVPGPSSYGSGTRGAFLDGDSGLVQGMPAVAATDGSGAAQIDFATTFAPGDNFRIVASVNASRINELGDIPTTGAVFMPGGAVSDQLVVWRHFHIEHDTMATTQGDQQNGTITAAQAGQDPGQFVVTTDIEVDVDNQYQNGILRSGGVNYPIVSSTAGTTATFTIEATAPPPNQALTVYDDDWTASGNDTPTTIVNTQDDSHLYDFLQPTTIRAENRFADAYMIPELHTLDQFSSNNVPATTHIETQSIDDTDPSLAPIIDGANPPLFRGTAAPGSETPLFWVVYVCTAFQGKAGMDGDPDSTPRLMGSPSAIGGEIAVVFLEAIRDQSTAANAPGVNEAMLKATVTTHEIGHEFGLAHPQGGAVPESIMGYNTESPDFDIGEFYFLDTDIDKLRNSSASP